MHACVGASVGRTRTRVHTRPRLALRRAKEFQRQRDAVQRERARLQEQLTTATSDARAASEREHALFVRATVLEQQLQSACMQASLPQAAELSAAKPRTSAPSAEPGGSVLSATLPPGPPLTIEQALDSIGMVNEKWLASTAARATP